MLPTTTVLSGDGTWWWAGACSKGHRWLSRRDLSGRRPRADRQRRHAHSTPDFLAGGVAALAGRQRTLLSRSCTTGESGEFMELGVHVNWRRLTVQRGQGPGPGSTASRPAACSSPPPSSSSSGGSTRGCCPTTCPTTSSRSGRSDGASRSCPIPVSALVRRERDGHPVRLQDVRPCLPALDADATIGQQPDLVDDLLLLASPRRLLPGNLIRVWRRFGSGLVAARRSRSRA